MWLQVTYSCVVFRPFKGEVLDAVVTQVTKARPPLPSRPQPLPSLPCHGCSLAPFCCYVLYSRPTNKVYQLIYIPNRL